MIFNTIISVQHENHIKLIVDILHSLEVSALIWSDIQGAPEMFEGTVKRNKSAIFTRHWTPNTQKRDQRCILEDVLW